MRGYYSVFDPDGKKIADCGIERDAVNLRHFRNKYWDGHYHMQRVQLYVQSPPR